LQRKKQRKKQRKNGKIDIERGTAMEERGKDTPSSCGKTKEVREIRDGRDGVCSLLDFDLGSEDVARAALLVALTKNAEMEDSFKRSVERWGWRVVATEVGGLLNDLPTKLVRAIVGASLNAGVVEKNSREMHSLVHAAMEAGDSFVHRGILEISVGAKISIVRNEQWIAVAIFGDCAIHASAHHDRCGLGVMHI
jgi:hut operon positive regulator